MRIVAETTVRGIDAPVLHALPTSRRGAGRQGIALSATMVDGKGRVVVAVQHKDGTLLACLLDEEAVERFATQLAIVVEQGNEALAAHRQANDR